MAVRQAVRMAPLDSGIDCAAHLCRAVEVAHCRIFVGMGKARIWQRNRRTAPGDDPHSRWQSRVCARESFFWLDDAAGPAREDCGGNAALSLSWQERAIPYGTSPRPAPCYDCETVPGFARL